ncbi:nucleoside triphosphatase YtkD [Barrientosiimonas marina]|uniref:RNA deprotection pyrophosphohydrolase n=2 Tax=Lentibacillus kimchii TaxID=1542911 RepID=A0ABW2US44_9BACI
MQHTFKDYYRNEVTLSFADHPFSQSPKHVWVICHYHHKWLLTRHKERGLEFPGGKVEKDEAARDAAIREVKEETGGTVASIRYIGQYIVAGKTETIVKNIYFADIGELAEQETYYETEGPFVLAHLPRNVKSDKRYSFIMKDDVLTHAIAFIKRKGLRNRP